MKLFTESVVAIDGSKFKAVKNRDRNFTEKKIKSRLVHLEKAVQHYVDDLDRADREPSLVPEARVSQLKEKIASIKAEMRRLATLPDQNAAQGQNRDEFARAGLQHEAYDKPPWNKGSTAGDHGVGRSHLLFIVTTVIDARKRRCHTGSAGQRPKTSIADRLRMATTPFVPQFPEHHRRRCPGT
jgi:hypothetical protein